MILQQASTPISSLLFPLSRLRHWLVVRTRLPAISPIMPIMPLFLVYKAHSIEFCCTPLTLMMLDVHPLSITYISFPFLLKIVVVPAPNVYPEDSLHFSPYLIPSSISKLNIFWVQSFCLIFILLPYYIKLLTFYHLMYKRCREFNFTHLLKLSFEFF